jgi:hypothetical protein
MQLLIEIGPHEAVILQLERAEVYLPSYVFTMIDGKHYKYVGIMCKY